MSDYTNLRGAYNYKNNNYNIPTYEQNSIDIYDTYNGFIRGNMFKDLYNTYKIDTPYEIMPMNEQAEWLTYIDTLAFALIDIGLYLDIHGDDKNAIDIYNQYRQYLGEYMIMYQNKYGPLTKTSDALNMYPWQWDNSPWPWEKGV